MTIAALACPEGYEVTAGSDGFADDCRLILNAADVPALDPGFEWDTPPVVSGIDIEITDAVGPLRIGDGDGFEGGGICNPGTMVCSIGGSYLWTDVIAGETSVRQLNIPSGLTFDGATLALDGGDSAALTPVGGSVAFDTTGFEGATLMLFDIGTLATAPTVTLPPTSTDSPPAPAGSSAMSLVVIGLITAAAAGVAFTVRRRDRSAT